MMVARPHEHMHQFLVYMTTENDIDVTMCHQCFMGWVEDIDKIYQEKPYT